MKVCANTLRLSLQYSMYATIRIALNYSAYEIRSYCILLHLSFIYNTVFSFLSFVRLFAIIISNFQACRQHNLWKLYYKRASTFGFVSKTLDNLADCRRQLWSLFIVVQRMSLSKEKQYFVSKSVGLTLRTLVFTVKYHLLVPQTYPRTLQPTIFILTLKADM